MKLDVYDTYATASDGSLLHFDVFVVAGTPVHTVSQVAHDFARCDDPEIEMELNLWKSSRIDSVDAEALVAVHRKGFAIVPLSPRQKKAA